jgi:rhodanese-related sulfurtransferase
LIEPLKNKSKSQFGAVLIALLIAAGLAYYLIGPNSIADRQNYEQILKLYMGYKKEFPDVQDVSPREAMEVVNTGKVVFVDVRGANEQKVSRLPGAISADVFLENLEKYNNFIKIGYDTIGYRSGVLAQELYHRGIPIYNLRGGLLAWVHAGGRVYKGTDETRSIHVYSREWDLGPAGYESVR